MTPRLTSNQRPPPLCLPLRWTFLTSRLPFIRANTQYFQNTTDVFQLAENMRFVSCLLFLLDRSSRHLPLLFSMLLQSWEVLPTAVTDSHTVFNCFKQVENADFHVFGCSLPRVGFPGQLAPDCLIRRDINEMVSPTGIRSDFAVSPGSPYNPSMSPVPPLQNPSPLPGYMNRMNSFAHAPVVSARPGCSFAKCVIRTSSSHHRLWPPASASKYNVATSTREIVIGSR